MSEVIELGGLKFRPLKNSTLEHDFYLMGHVRAAQLDTVTKEDHESYDDFVQRLLSQVLKSGRWSKLLAGLLIPENVMPEDWSEGIALEVEEHVKKLTQQKDKETVKTIVVSMLLDFFLQGLLSPTISRTSSNRKSDVSEQEPLAAETAEH